MLNSGADKVSVNSSAIQNPDLIRAGAERFGNQCIVLGMDAKRVGVSEKIPSGYEIYIKGGRAATGLDAVEWAKRAESLGAGEICLNAMDTDGVQNGYELEITDKIAKTVGIPVIASGGAGKSSHIVELFQRTAADAALVASMVHFGTCSIGDIKRAMEMAKIPVRKSERL